MRSQNGNRGNRNKNGNRNGNRAQSYAGSNYRSGNDEQRYGYNDYDREYNTNDREYNTYDRSEADRYANYEGNYGRGNYEHRATDYTYGRDHSRDNRNDYNIGTRYSSGNSRNSGSRNWDSQEPGYYGRYDSNEGSYSDYGGTRRRDEKDWGDGRHYASEYDDNGRYNDYDRDRGFFGRVGERIRNTWHDITDRDDTQENMRRLKQGSSYGDNAYNNRNAYQNNNTYGDRNTYENRNSYENRGNYRPYPEGSSDSQYGSNTRARNANRGTYGEDRNQYGGYGLDRQDFNW